MAIPLQEIRSAKPPDNQAAQHQFQYQPLATQHTFRLLRLQAGTGSTITGSLVHHTLGSAACPQYRALSYTWGNEAARFNIHIDGNEVFKVRQNLYNALRSVRDEQSDCWLWVDAICINQASDAERDQQVKLMADIYSGANMVLVWLQSANESANVAAAFKFVHAAATYDGSYRSVIHYNRAHAQDRKKNWRSLQQLCQLRYWTRKWIIQELIMARTVVLQVGRSTCSMNDLETFCVQILQSRYRALKRGSSNGRPDPLDLVIGSSAARLALQRSEPTDNQRPRLLYELVERYSSNQCQEPRDHVYALYSLVGNHRSNLSIDHAASPVQRLVSVLSFVHIHEQLSPSRALAFASLLAKLFKIDQNELHRNRSLLATLQLRLPFTFLGTVNILHESAASIALRGMVDPLHPVPGVLLHTCAATWIVSGYEDAYSGPEPVGRPDMTYFSIGESDFSGLAACRLEEGDLIFYIPGTQLVFAVRYCDERSARVLGRAYLFSAGKNSGTPEFWLERGFDLRAVSQGEIHVSMDLATLFDFQDMAVLIDQGGLMVKRDESWRWKSLAQVLMDVWRRHWSSIIIVGCCGSIIAFMLAVIAVQVTS